TCASSSASFSASPRKSCRESVVVVGGGGVVALRQRSIAFGCSVRNIHTQRQGAAAAAVVSRLTNDLGKRVTFNAGYVRAEVTGHFWRKTRRPSRHSGFGASAVRERLKESEIKLLD
ncbi:unnamed protein product, partial [Ectocarpus sp. 13 AM-2016]